MNLYFTYESRDTLKSFTLFITVETTLKLNAKHSDKYEIKILKFSRRGPRSPDNAEFGHFGGHRGNTFFEMRYSILPVSGTP